MLSLFLELLFPLIIAFAVGSLLGWLAMRILVRPIPRRAAHVEAEVGR